MSEGHLHLLCGKMASGKSTLAKHLVSGSAGVLLSEDEWLSRLYPGVIVDLPSYIEHSRRLKSVLQHHVVSLLRQDLTLVLDFPANTVMQRAWLVDIAKQAQVTCTLHYLDCSDELCIARLKVRRIEQPERSATDTPEMFMAVTAHFEVPDVREGLNIQLHEQSAEDTA